MNEDLQGELSATKIKSLLAVQQNLSPAAQRYSFREVRFATYLSCLTCLELIKLAILIEILFCNKTLRIELSLIQPNFYDSIIQASDRPTTTILHKNPQMPNYNLDRA